MSDKWRGLHGPITAAAADAEPEHERLFGSSWMRQAAAVRSDTGINKATYRPWRKPLIERKKETITNGHKTKAH